ncbi:hypothetical protein K7X08_018309 [Anisodus acutangulus]|uniref:Uncharacterized protein n=1 Tax=Anisodus acutangulus TaxID=402998 RepID=A0A9Q1LXH4_9SOLA|nr:hypothetical protein K7X08_018309 [Anisodus acutangulus]
MDAPEVVLCQAHGQARTLSDFLHENVLDFMSEEAIDDADFGAENLIQSAAASVAARGVLFGNAHPASSRWHATIRRPKLWEVEQSSRRNKCQMLSQRCDLYNSLTISDQIVTATEFRPALKWLGYRASESYQADNMIEDDSNSTCLHEDKLDISDDEIEDC